MIFEFFRIAIYALALLMVLDLLALAKVVPCRQRQPIAANVDQVINLNKTYLYKNLY